MYVNAHKQCIILLYFFLFHILFYSPTFRFSLLNYFNSITNCFLFCFFVAYFHNFYYAQLHFICVHSYASHNAIMSLCPSRLRVVVGRLYGWIWMERLFYFFFSVLFVYISFWFVFNKIVFMILCIKYLNDNFISMKRK